MKVYSEPVAPPLRIYVGTTAIHFRAAKNGSIGGGVNLGKFIQSYLLESEYDYRLSRWLPTYRYCTYDEENSMAYLPRFTLDKLEATLRQFGVHFEVIQDEPYTPRAVKIPLKKHVAPRENQHEIIDFLSNTALEFKPLSARTGIGKGLPNETPVKIPGGWKPIGTLNVGDVVTAQDGTPSRVIGVYPQGTEEIWEIEFKDYRTIETDSDHLWTIYSSPYSDKTQVVSTEELSSLVQKEQIHIPVICSEQGPEKTVSIDPYIFGAFIGKGYLLGGQLYLEVNEEVIDKIIARLPGCICIKTKRYDVSYLIIRLSNSAGQKVLNAFTREVLNQQFWKRSIPAEYIEGSHEQRLALVQGLMEANGSNFSDEARYGTLSAILADQFRDLIWSLGGICYFRGIQGREYVFRIELPSPTKKLRLGIVSVVKTDRQKECTCIAIDHPSKLYVTKQYLATHNTACAIMSAHNLGLVTMVVLPLLIPQWYSEFKQFTQLKTADIYVIQGFNTLKKLWGMFKEGYRPKVIIFATRTLLLYAQSKTDHYDDLPSYQEFQKKFGIGVKIIDEVHLGFNTNVLIDLYSNIKHNIYLSATYGRSNHIGKRIFNTVFPPEMVYGSQSKKKYTIIYSVSYSIGLGGSEEDKFRTFQGYNHARYENYVLGVRELRQEFMTRVIPMALTEFYLNRQQPQFRALILCQTQRFAEAIYASINEYMSRYTFTDKKGKKHKRSIGLFFSGTTKQEELTKDIVISTIKSCGTGMDLKGLICCINTVSFSSSVLSVQMVGRLREIPDEDTVFVDLWCRDVSSHHRHISARMNEYTKIAKQVITTKL